MAEKSGGCARPTGARVGEAQSSKENNQPQAMIEEETFMTAKVGNKAPDFTAPAYYKGDFTEIKLSDYLGKWVLLCFYPGDFTFV